MYSFRASPDGAHPEAGLVDASGMLYGTTFQGGRPLKHAYGTVFSITTMGKEHVLYSFGDGARPAGGLTDVSGTLYGVTPGGGTYGKGSVFSITPSGSERVLYSFTGNDGDQPTQTLLDVNGTLYGTTFFGGEYGQGTVFSVDTTGNEQVLHSFGGTSADGHWPVSSLINVDGTLYGTTEYGGRYNPGTVFSIGLNGSEQVLFSFGRSRDGVRPLAGLVAVEHTLYGTTVNGGMYGRRKTGGTVYSITTTGEERVLHSFGRRSDGAAPEAGLISVNGTLYGTTAEGGRHGYGTVFALTP